MNTSPVCERCCEQAAGVSPEVDWKGLLIQHLESALVAAGRIAVAMVRVIGFACFFAVAIWFHPIKSLTGAERRRIQEARDRLQREEEDRRRREEAEAYDRQRDAAFHEKRIRALESSNNDDRASALGLINSTNYLNGRRHAEDQHLINHLNGIVSDYNDGLINPDLALIQHSRDLQEAKRNIWEEHIKDQERQRLQDIIARLDLEIRRQEAQPNPDRWRQEQEMNYLRDRRADAQWKYERLI